MKIFVYEYLCATINERPETTMPRVASLMAEGKAMLSAAIEDCSAIPCADVRTLLGARSASMELRMAESNFLACISGSEESEFRRLADWCDYALIIAPEFDRILETRCRWAVDCGAKLLGPPPEVVALCADKLALTATWERAGVKTPPTKLFDPGAFPLPVVVKPRDGAGAIDALLFDDVPIDYTLERESIIQPFVSGQPASVALMIGPLQTIALIPATQHINLKRWGLSSTSQSRRLEYCGGAVPLEPPLAARATEIASQAAVAIPKLFGYVGVDLVLGETDFAIEINPRMTTSYVGLRKLAHGNLMETLIHIVNGERCEPPSWRSDNVHFSADGHVTYAFSMRC
jgi:predicted ATP-grasp superfamily ATP-dependent carboligase